MIKFIGKSTLELRVATEEEADQLHKQTSEEAEKMGAVLTSWNETKREKKSKGETIEEWVIVKYTITFGDLKDPSVVLKNVNYDLTTGGYDDADVPFDGGNVISAF